MRNPHAKLPGRGPDLAQLITLYEHVAAEGRGQIMFVVGDDGSGRTTLLRELTHHLARVKPRRTRLAGSFADTGYVSWDTDERSARVVALVKQVLSVAQSIASLADGLLPFAGLLAEVVSKSAAALQLAERLVGEPQNLDLSGFMPRVLRQLCEDGPAVCIVDNADQAPSGWWADLLLLFARRVARDLPLLLILGLEGPSVLGGHEDDESDMLFAARQLTGDDLARWHPLTSITVQDLQDWTGGAAPEVLHALLEITGGRAGWTADLWRDWQQRTVVEQSDQDGRWRFTSHRAHALGEFQDHLGERLKRLAGADDLRAIDRARELLCCAALEGRSFTAEAVAAVLDRDRNEVIDYLDETLVFDDDHPDGLVIDRGFVAIDDEAGSRNLCLYRFNSELDWLTLRHYGGTVSRERDLSLRLANALRDAYGEGGRRIALTLSRLYDVAERSDEAGYYRRMGDLGVSRDVILWRASAVLSAPEPEDRSERRRASRILIAAGTELFHSGPFDDGLTFAEAARRLAVVESPSLSTSGETLTIEESMTLRARTETAGDVGVEHEWRPGSG